MAVSCVACRVGWPQRFPPPAHADAGVHACAARLKLKAELLVNVDSRVPVEAAFVGHWLDVLGPRDMLLLSDNVHELRACAEPPRPLSPTAPGRTASARSRA